MAGQSVAALMGGTLLWAVLGASTGSPSLARLPHAEGPPLGHTGGFGEPTCLVCHAEFEINPEGGTLRLDGLPDRYAPGRAYRVRISLAGEGMNGAGFEAAFRFASGDRFGQQAGEVRPLDGAVVVRDSLGVQYAHQSRAGSVVSEPDRADWTLEWIAPPGGASVEVHVAANSANGDNSPLGDWVFVDSHAVGAPTR